MTIKAPRLMSSVELKTINLILSWPNLTEEWSSRYVQKNCPDYP